MIILAIETSCDETSIAIIKDGKILSNIVSSQIKLHAKWGGVVPNLAAREHVKNIVPVLDDALAKAKINLTEVNLFAATKGPGLIPALLVGINAAKALSWFYKKPLIGINHIEAHLAASFINKKNKIHPPTFKNYPILALTVSGGHTQLIFIKKPFRYQTIGQTQDDAAGEAFDKVAKIMKLGYPGGPIISKYADALESSLKKIKNKKLQRELLSIKFPRPMINSNNFDFSFSGLKTSVMYFWKNLSKNKQKQKIYKQAIAKAFQDAAVDVLTTKTKKATEKFKPKTIILAGGVAANQKLRKSLQDTIKNTAKDTVFLVPDFSFCGDNAAMIATVAFFRYKKTGQLTGTKINWKTLEADSNLKIGK